MEIFVATIRYNWAGDALRQLPWRWAFAGRSRAAERGP